VFLLDASGHLLGLLSQAFRHVNEARIEGRFMLQKLASDRRRVRTNARLDKEQPFERKRDLPFLIALASGRQGASVSRTLCPRLRLD
jgi:hypothetical protein